LNQDYIVSTLLWNVTEELQTNQTDLSWSTLPENVKTFLLAQRVNFQVMNVTFAQWSWTESNGTFANTTLFSLLSPNAQQNLQTIEALLVPFTYNTVLNTTALVSERKASKAIKNLLEAIKCVLSFAPTKQEFGRHRKRVATPGDLMKLAKQQAKMIVKKYLN
jgi:hypothetical protein